MNKATHFRIMRDGAPYYVAPWVKDLSPRSRTELFQPMSYSAPASVREACAAVRHPQTTYLPLFSDPISIAAE